MKDSVKKEILAHAWHEFPRECCGLILNVNGVETYFPTKNISENATDFIMDPNDFAEAEDKGEILAVVHSHCNIPARPSQADLVGCEKSGLPWHIVSVPTEKWETIFPSGYRAPLVGRQFHHGVLDCFALVRDWYEKELGIEIPDFERVEEWWRKGENYFLDNYERLGWESVKIPERGDVLIMQLGSSVPNHAAIYLGENVMLHHLNKRLSSREIYGGYWMKCTRLVLRYKKRRPCEPLSYTENSGDDSEKYTASV